MSRPHGKECRRAHQSGYDVRRRGPAKTAYGGGATRASNIGLKRAEVALEGQIEHARVELAQESRAMR